MSLRDSVSGDCVQHEEVILLLARSVMSSALLSHSDAFTLNELARNVLGSIILSCIHSGDRIRVSFDLLILRFHNSPTTVSIVCHSYIAVIYVFVKV